MYPHTSSGPAQYVSICAHVCNNTAGDATQVRCNKSFNGASSALIRVVKGTSYVLHVQWYSRDRPKVCIFIFVFVSLKVCVFEHHVCAREYVCVCEYVCEYTQGQTPP